MREFEQRRHPVRILSLRLFMVLLLLIAVLLARSVWNMYQKERETYSGRFNAEQELAELNEREYALRTHIARLRSPQGVEESLREQFDMAKEGEGVIVIINNSPPQEKEEETINLTRMNTWKRLIPLAPWELFGL